MKHQWLAEVQGFEGVGCILLAVRPFFSKFLPSANRMHQLGRGREVADVQQFVGSQRNNL